MRGEQREKKSKKDGQNRHAGTVKFWH